MTKAQNVRIAEEVDRRRNAGEIISQKSIAEWAFEELSFSLMQMEFRMKKWNEWRQTTIDSYFKK